MGGVKKRDRPHGSPSGERERAENSHLQPTGGGKGNSEEKQTREKEATKAAGIEEGKRVLESAAGEGTVFIDGVEERQLSTKVGFLPGFKAWPREQPVWPFEVWGLLNSTPVYPKAVPSHSLKSLGFRAKCATESKKTEKFHRQLDKPPSFEKDYGYVFPTFEAVYRRTERFDRPVPVYDAATVKRWTGHLQREYSTIGKTHVRDFDNLYIRHGS